MAHAVCSLMFMLEMQKYHTNDKTHLLQTRHRSIRAD